MGKRVFLSVLGVGVIGGGIVLFSRPISETGLKPRLPAATQNVPLGKGEPRYGGKPTLPVFIESDVQGPIEAGKWVSIQLSVVIEMECSEFSLQLRGLNGVEVDSTSPNYSCDSRAPLIHRAQVRVAEGGSGVLAVDVAVVSEEGERQVTRMIPFEAEGGERQTLEKE